MINYDIEGVLNLAYRMAVGLGEFSWYYLAHAKE